MCTLTNHPTDATANGDGWRCTSLYHSRTRYVTLLRSYLSIQLLISPGCVSFTKVYDSTYRIRDSFKQQRMTRADWKKKSTHMLNTADDDISGIPSSVTKNHFKVTLHVRYWQLSWVPRHFRSLLSTETDGGACRWCDVTDDVFPDGEPVLLANDKDLLVVENFR